MGAVLLAGSWTVQYTAVVCQRPPQGNILTYICSFFQDQKVRVSSHEQHKDYWWPVGCMDPVLDILDQTFLA